MSQLLGWPEHTCGQGLLARVTFVTGWRWSAELCWEWFVVMSGAGGLGGAVDVMLLVRGAQ